MNQYASVVASLDRGNQASTRSSQQGSDETPKAADSTVTSQEPGESTEQSETHLSASPTPTPFEANHSPPASNDELHAAK